LEAMAAGVPIVATAVGGVPEMLENGKTALLVSSGNADEMASAIAELLSKRDESARLSANARTLSHNRFSPENYVKTFSEICRDVVGNRAGS
jgi:glycosyltransferase involved in cell wall biosynthesis